MLAEETLENMAAAVEVLEEMVTPVEKKVSGEDDEALGNKLSAADLTEIETAADGRNLKVSAEEWDDTTAAAAKGV